MKTILIVEDQKEQASFLSKQLDNMGLGFNIISSPSKVESYKIAVEENVDLFFIDIGLPDGSGMDLALELRRIKKYELTWIVFLTSHNEFILEAFQKTHCYDFLIKPYNAHQIIEITKRLTSATIIKEHKASYISFQMKGIILKININDIIFVEVFNKNCTIHTHRKKYLIKKTPLNKVSDMLPQDIFFQCHRSYIINSACVELVKKVENIWEIEFKDYNEKAILGETFKNSIINKLKLSINEN